MREIKFRAWAGEVRNSIGRLLYRPRMLYDEKPGDCLRWLADGQDIEVMQFTGLHDKNGKEIYEGDVVDRKDKGIFVVRWEPRCAGFVMSADDDSWKWPKEDYRPIYEVIGNIYENPELLEGE